MYVQCSVGLKTKLSFTEVQEGAEGACKQKELSPLQIRVTINIHFFFNLCGFLLYLIQVISIISCFRLKELPLLAILI